ncbi:TPA: hypothetical protein DDW35_05920 [Candidatus Sumerlaeota bacterium]|nr:hypothetical protein [Candidatus Sumerlaeota bacterium]
MTKIFSLSMLILLLGLAVVLGMETRYPIYRIQEAASYPYQLDAEEGFILKQAMRLADGHMLYQSIDKPPYLVDNYPPLYPALWSLFVDQTHPSLAAGRWISGASGWIAAAAIFLMIFLAARGVPFLLAFAVALIPPMLFMTSYAFLRWVGYTRVDMLALALSLVGLAIFQGRGNHPNRWQQGVAIGFFLLAALTKQTAVLAAGACFLQLLLQKKWRNALGFAVAMAVGILVPYGTLVAVTHGGYWKHVVTYNENVMSWNEIWIFWGPQLWQLYHFLWVAALAFLGWGAWNTLRKNASLPTLPTLYFLLTFASIVTVAKAGSAENYVLEPMAGLALFLGASLVALLRTTLNYDAPRRSRIIAVSVTTLSFSLLLAHAIFFYQVEQILFMRAPRPNGPTYAADNQVMRILRERPGRVLAEDPIYAILDGRALEFHNFIMTQLTLEKKWDETPFLKSVQERQFSLLIAHTDIRNEDQYCNRYSPALREMLRQNYELLKTLERPQPLQPIYLFVPKGTVGK